MRRPLVLLTLGILFTACGGSDDAGPAESAALVEDPGIVHVHGLGRNPTDAALFIATHTGLFRLAEGGSPQRVAGNDQDTMGFSVVGPDRFLGSGHPGSAPDDPPFLGLIESRDAGRRWRSVSLRGKVDFHALASRGPAVYGFGSDWETREGRFLVSQDGGRSWERRAVPEPLNSLAVQPRDGRHVLAAGSARSYVSADQGATWRPLPLPGGFVAWTKSLGPVSVGLDGSVRRASEPLAEWRETGRVDGEPAAVGSSGDELLVATHDGRVSASRDGGKRWVDLLAG
jgi:hypothetical protein